MKDKLLKDIEHEDKLYEYINKLEILFMKDILYKKVENIIKTELSAREQEIIINRFGLYGNQPKTQIEIAEELNISRSYISRLEKKAINLIKSKCKL